MFVELTLKVSFLILTCFTAYQYASTMSSHKMLNYLCKMPDLLQLKIAFEIFHCIRKKEYMVTYSLYTPRLITCCCLLIIWADSTTSYSGYKYNP